MAQGITFDLKARVTGYESSLTQLKRAFDKIDPGSSIGKKLAKAIEDAEAKLKGLNKNLTPKAISNTQIDNIIEKTNAAGDSILNVVHLLQQVNMDDIDFSVFDTSIKELTQNLAALEDELNNNISEGIKKTISDSEELSQSFNDLGIDIKDKNVTQIFDAISEKAKVAAKDTEMAKEALESAQNDLVSKQNKLTQLENNPLYNKGELKQDLTNIVSEYTKTFDNIKNSVQTGLSNLLNGNKKKTNEMMEVFTQGLTPNNLKQHLMTLKNTLQTELKSGLSAKEIYTALLGDAGSAGNAQAITTQLLTNLNKILPDMKQQFQGKFQEIVSSLTKNEVGQITTLINEGDFEGALRTSLRAIERGYKTLVGGVEQGKIAVAEAMKARDEAQTNYDNASTAQTNIDSIKSDLIKRLETVEKENQSLKDEITKLRNQINERKQNVFSDVKTGDNAPDPNDYKISSEERQKYIEQLDQIHEKEKLIGKVEGLVQRWFSIYAAVRMVNNAIHSIISTVRELDKTITEIAIVTDMTQDDLWGQMSDYTEMARQYAASISGVYQVSQLYYQQGMLNI